MHGTATATATARARRLTCIGSYGEVNRIAKASTPSYLILQGLEKSERYDSSDPAPVKDQDRRPFRGWELADHDREALETQRTLRDLIMILSGSPADAHDGNACVAERVPTG